MFNCSPCITANCCGLASYASHICHLDKNRRLLWFAAVYPPNQSPRQNIGDCCGLPLYTCRISHLDKNRRLLLFEAVYPPNHSPTQKIDDCCGLLPPGQVSPPPPKFLIEHLTSRSCNSELIT